MRRQRALFAAIFTLGVLCFAGGVGAQDPAPQDSGVEERVEVKLVQIPILAVDRNGNPITDLSSEEITVKVRGKARRVAFLDKIADDAPPAELPIVKLYVDAPGGAPATGTTTPPSDRLLLFLDVANDDDLGKRQSIIDTMEFVDSLQPGTSLAVLAFNGDTELELPFTTDRGRWKPAVERALARAPKRTYMDLRSRIEGLVDSLSDCVTSGGEFSRVVGDERCLRDVVQAYSEETRPRTAQYLNALDDAISLLSGVQGARTMVALSHGVAVDPASEVMAAANAVFGPSPQLSSLHLHMGFGDTRRRLKESMLKTAQEEGVLLYFMDRMRPPSSDSGARSRISLQPGAQPIFDAYKAAQLDLQQFGAATGGVFVASTDVADGLTQIQRSRTGAYVLGYYVEAKDIARGSKLSIDCTRRRVSIRHRQEYFAPRVPPPLPGRIILGAPSPASGADQVARHEFTLEVDPSAIGYRLDERAARSDFTIQFTIENLTGITLAESFHLLNHAYSRDMWDSPDRAPVTIRGWVELPAGGFFLRAHVRNADDGRSGVLSTAIEVAPAEGS